MVSPTGDSDHHVLRAVVLLKEPADVWCAERSNGRLGAERVAPETRTREEQLRRQLGCGIGGLIAVHGQFFGDHQALSVDVFWAKRRFCHDVAQDLERHRRIIGQEACVEGGVLLRREGVAIATDRIEVLSDRGSRARRRPLEQQVLQEMRSAGHRLGFITGSNVDEESNGDRGDSQRLRDDGTTVGERQNFQ